MPLGCSIQMSYALKANRLLKAMDITRFLDPCGAQKERFLPVSQREAPTC
jgi:hypothetical protein